MEIFWESLQKIRVLTGTIEPWWTIILVPIWQEVIFRYLPFRFWYLPMNNFWMVGIVSSIVFALIHWYFGGWFIILAFVVGFLYWLVMIEFGLVSVIFVHALVNLIDITFGIRQLLVTEL